MSLADDLRALADAVDSGQYLEAHCLAWVIDSSNGKFATGMAGGTVKSEALTHNLLTLGMLSLEGKS